MRSTLRHALTCIALIAPGAAMAENIIRDILPRPSDCVARMTVQRHGCSVLTILQCGPGDREIWRTEASNSDGLHYVEHGSRDGSISIHADASGRGGFFSDPSASRTTPFAEIAASGSGSSLTVGTFDLFGAQKTMTIAAELSRLDPPLTLDGVTLTRIAGNAVVTMPQPMPQVTIKNVLYFDPVSGAAFEGESEASWPPPDGDEQPTPAAIILPGEPGFDEPHPTYDCGNLSYNHLDIKADQA